MRLLVALLIMAMLTPLPAADGSAAEPAGANASPWLTFVAGYSPSIESFVLDPATGALHASATTAAPKNPSYITWDAAHRHLYALHEQYPGKISAFAIGAGGVLTLLDTVASGGMGPCHLAVHPNGKFVAVAHYNDGDVSILPIHDDGSIGATVASITAGKNAHEVVFDPTGNFLLVPYKGSDAIAILACDGATGALHLSATAGTAANAGPRHLVFNAAGTTVYVINENDSTVATYAWANGALTPRATVSTLAPGTTTKNTGAEIQLAPSGKFLYASNRGDDSIAIFRIDGDGLPQPVAWEHAGGVLKEPRHFSLSPDGSIMLVAAQKTGTVTSLRVDAATGLLTVLATTAVPAGPAFVGVLTVHE